MGDIVKLVRREKFVGWYVRYMDRDGKRKMRASHQPTRELARRYLLEIEGRVARGALGIPEPTPNAPTVLELIERFLAEYNRPRIKDLSRYRRAGRTALQRVVPILGPKRADSVQTADLDKLREVLGRKLAAASVYASMSFLGAMYSWAMKAKLVSGNPLRGVERPTVQSSIDYLSREEVRALLHLAQQRAASGDLSDRVLYACVQLALHTGLRKGELLGLRRRDVDLETKRLTVARSFQRSPKSNKPRYLRLPAACVAVLAEWLRECPPTEQLLVFPVIRRGLPIPGAEHHMMGLNELITAAGSRRLPHPWHALRHTYASHYVMSGGNILSLQKILGHSDLRMTLQYAHLAPDFLGEEMERVKF